MDAAEDECKQTAILAYHQERLNGNLWMSQFVLLSLGKVTQKFRMLALCELLAKIQNVRTNL